MSSGAPSPETLPEITLPITGMTCTNCSATVERTLRKTPGVADAVVNYATERPTVRLADPSVDVIEVAEAVGRVGYGVNLADQEDVADAEAAARTAEIAHQTLKFKVGVAFSLSLFLRSAWLDFGLLGTWTHAPWVSWLMFALATFGSTVAYVYFGGGHCRRHVGIHRRRGARLLRDGGAHHHPHKAGQAP